MRVDHRLPVVVGELVNQVVAEDSGARDEDVESPLRLGGEPDGSLNLGARGHIATHRTTADLPGCLLGCCEIEVRHDDICALRCEACCRRGADPICAAGDERRLAREASGRAHRNFRSTISATQTGLSPPSRSIVVSNTA